MLNKGVHFLTDTLGKVNGMSGGIRGIAKGLDQMGVGGGRIGGFVNRGLDFAGKAERSLREFGGMSPAQKSKRLGNLAGRGLSSVFGQANDRLGGGAAGAAVGRGLGQMGGNFISQGLSRLLG